jgi:hypothetical protein
MGAGSQIATPDVQHVDSMPSENPKEHKGTAGPKILTLLSIGFPDLVIGENHTA